MSLAVGRESARSMAFGPDADLSRLDRQSSEASHERQQCAPIFGVQR